MNITIKKKRKKVKIPLSEDIFYSQYEIKFRHGYQISLRIDFTENVIKYRTQFKVFIIARQACIKNLVMICCRPVGIAVWDALAHMFKELAFIHNVYLVFQWVQWITGKIKIRVFDLIIKKCVTKSDFLFKILRVYHYCILVCITNKFSFAKLR